MEIKSWLEFVTGLPVTNTAFVNPPPLPYVVFLDDQAHSGADDKLLLCEHDLSIELYSEDIQEDIEQKIEKELAGKGIEFEKSCGWICEEGFYQTFYTMTILEKMEE